jgi:hypothetical protein
VTDDIAFLARIAYGSGIDPITYAAEHVIQSHVEIFLAVREVGAELGVAAARDTGALSRRILGDLMDAGWTPPALTPEPEP